MYYTKEKKKEREREYIVKLIIKPAPQHIIHLLSEELKMHRR